MYEDLNRSGTGLKLTCEKVFEHFFIICSYVTNPKCTQNSSLLNLAQYSDYGDLSTSGYQSTGQAGFAQLTAHSN